MNSVSRVLIACLIFFVGLNIGPVAAVITAPARAVISALDNLTPGSGAAILDVRPNRFANLSGAGSHSNHAAVVIRAASKR